jgi:tripartite-type tricarboxylate transporter receptor subunit TctC
MKKLLLIILLSLSTLAWSWEPTEPVKVIIGYGPGSGNELLFRKAESIINQQSNTPKFVLDFKPGANELIAMNTFAQAKNDGLTLFVPATAVWVTTPVWYKKNLIQDPTEWNNVISLGQTQFVLYATKSSDVSNTKQFIDRLQTNSRVNIATGSGLQTLMYDYIIHSTKAKDTQLIQYNGPAQVAQAVASGQVEFGIGPLSFAYELARAGKVKIIGITGSQTVDGIPKLNEQIKGLDLIGIVGIVLPKDTPKDIIVYYRKLFGSAVNTKAYQDFLKEIHWYDDLKTPEHFQTFITESSKKWIPVAKKLNPL